MSSRNGFIETHIYDYILANSLRDRDEAQAVAAGNPGHAHGRHADFARSGAVHWGCSSN